MRFWKCIRFAFIFAGAFCMVLVQTGLSQSSTQTMIPNERILSASSPFEDMTEFAIAGDKTGIQRSLRTYDSLAAGVEHLLPQAIQKQLHKVVSGIREASQQGKLDIVALNAPEAYRLLLEGLDTHSLKVPVEVSLLDYVGFKFLGLLHFKAGEWQALEENARFAKKNWDAIRKRISDHGLRDVLDTTLNGLMEASVKKNSDMALFAAKSLLSQVDLLEAYFNKSAQ